MALRRTLVLLAILALGGLHRSAVGQRPGASGVERAFDVSRPESLSFVQVDFEATRSVDMRASSLALKRGWRLYVLDERGPWPQSSLVAARSLDRVLRRAVPIEPMTLRFLLTGTEADPRDKVRDHVAAREFVRLISEGAVIADSGTGARIWAAARRFARHFSAEDLQPEKARGLYESPRCTQLQTHGKEPRSWRSRVLRRPDGAFGVRMHVLRSSPFEVVRIDAILRRNARIEIRERLLVTATEDASGRPDLLALDRALIRDCMAAAMDLRRTRAFLDVLLDDAGVLGGAELKLVHVIEAMGAPDYDFGRGERVLAYRLFDGSFLEFVGHGRVREVRIAQCPRPRSLLRDDVVSGPTIDRLWRAPVRRD